MSPDADRTGVATADLWADITRDIHEFSPRPVGFGGYSDIYTATWRRKAGDMKVAVKVIRAIPTPSETGELPRALRREISVWRRLSHPNIHVLCGFYEGFGSAPALVSPWYDNGDINEYTRQRAADPDIGLLKLKLFADVATGLRFLHENHVVHGDIKGRNILISDDGMARLCDFGLSRLLLEHSQSTTATGGTGTSRWMAPELHLVEGARHTYASDIWACGCLFIEVWSHVLPYHTKSNEKQVMLALWQQEAPARPAEMPDIIWTIVQACCNFDIPSRPSPLRVGGYLSLHLTMQQRIHPMVMRGRPFDPVGSQILRDIESSLQAADWQHLAGLYILSDIELVTEMLRILAIFSLSHPGGSSLFEDAVFQWLLIKLPTSSLLPPAGVPLGFILSNNNNNNRLYQPEKLRPLARLVGLAHPSRGEEFMIQFANPALRSPLQFDTAVKSVAWLPDGLRIVVGCKAVRILDTASGSTLLRLVGHTREVNQVSVSPNEKFLASCSGDRTIRLWDAETGHTIGAPMVGHNGYVWSVAFSPDGRHIVSGSDDDTIRMWNIEACTTVLGPLCGHTGSVYSVAYSPDGSRIVSGGVSAVQIWDARTGDLILTLRGHTDSARSVAYSPDGLRVVSGSDDCTVRIWDAATGQQVGSPLRGHSDYVRSVAYSLDGTRIVSGSEDHTLRIWNVATCASIATLRGHAGWVCSAVFSPDGRQLASAADDRTVRIWDATDDWRCWDI